MIVVVVFEKVGANNLEFAEVLLALKLMQPVVSLMAYSPLVRKLVLEELATQDELERNK